MTRTKKGYYMPSTNLGDIYFKISTSSVPTDYDKIGCDGMYIKDCVRVTSTNSQSDAITLWKEALIAFNNGELVLWFGENGKRINAVVA